MVRGMKLVDPITSLNALQKAVRIACEGSDKSILNISIKAGVDKNAIANAYKGKHSPNERNARAIVEATGLDFDQLMASIYNEQFNKKQKAKARLGIAA